MSAAARAILLAVLAAVGLAYFALVAWRAESFAGVLLERGYEGRGWTEKRLARRLKIIGIAGAVFSAVALGVALVRLVGV